ncbi:STAS domain-containing protein [Peribacillus kribbensis]|uniref:STAS domain-containing protein n=1 Tax=Peribacillus kribbensis TaxID=356658 RepID=UPI00040F11DC|nr:STAS domain-containing protein [Peribacillus kribbensis]
MKTELQLIGDVIIQKKEEIAQIIHQKRMSGVVLTEQEEREFNRIENTIMEIRQNFITLFGEALIHNMDEERANQRIREWGSETGMFLYHLGAPLDEALKDTSYYRIYIWKVIEEEVKARDLSSAVIFEILRIIDPLLDRAVYYFSLTYVGLFQKTLENSKSAFLELSVPVVPLIKGVGVLPLIGNIDTERASLLMEETLRRSAELNLSHLILDVSGVPIVDTMVADQLFKVMDALALTGVATIITGIRPEVAQTIVNLGINLENVMIKANLQQAFTEIQAMKSLQK